MNQLKETLEAKENETISEKDRLKKDEDGIVFDRDAIDGQRANDWPSVLKNWRSVRRGYCDGLASR